MTIYYDMAFITGLILSWVARFLGNCGLQRFETTADTRRIARSSNMYFLFEATVLFPNTRSFHYWTALSTDLMALLLCASWTQAIGQHQEPWLFLSSKLDLVLKAERIFFR